MSQGVRFKFIHFQSYHLSDFEIPNESLGFARISIQEISG